MVMYVDNDSEQSTAKETVTGGQSEDAAKREGQPRQASRGRRRGGGGRHGKHQAPPPPPQPPQPPEPTVNLSSDEVKEATLALKGMLGIGAGGGGDRDEDDNDEGFGVPPPAVASALASALAATFTAEDDAEEPPPTAPASKKKKNNRNKKKQQQRQEQESATAQTASALEEAETITPPLPPSKSKNSKQKQNSKNRKKDKAGRGGGRGGDASASSGGRGGGGGRSSGRGNGGGEEKYAWSAFQSAPDAALLPMPAFGSSSSSLLPIAGGGSLDGDSDFLAATEPRLLPDKAEEDTVHAKEEEVTELEPHTESADSTDEGEDQAQTSPRQAVLSESPEQQEEGSDDAANNDDNDGAESAGPNAVDDGRQKTTDTSSPTEDVVTGTVTPMTAPPDEVAPSVPATADSGESKTEDADKEDVAEPSDSGGNDDGPENASGGINLAALATNSPPNKSNAQQPVPPAHQQPPQQQQQMQSITAMMGGTYMAAQQQQQQQQQQQGPYINHAYAHQAFQHLHGTMQQGSSMMGMAPPMGGPLPHHPHAPLVPHPHSLATPQPPLQPHQQHRYGAGGGGGTPPAPPPSAAGAGFLTMHVQVPPGLPRVGGQMMVQTPSGYPVPVMVPDGVAPGMVIAVNIPAPGAGNRPPPPVYSMGGGRGPHPPHHPPYQPMQFPPQMSSTRGMGPHGMMGAGGGAPAGGYHPGFGPHMGPMPPPPPPPPPAQQDTSASNADVSNNKSTTSK